VYIGGGTPSLLPPQEIFRLLAVLSPGSGEVTVEANPGDINVEWLDAIRAGGATRLSLGVQSLDAQVLKQSGRRSNSPQSSAPGANPRDTALAALSLIRNHWTGGFSADIIAGLPGETLTGFLAGLKELLFFNPSHISMYSLIIGEQTPLGRRCASDAALEQELLDSGDELWLAGRDFLEDAGFAQYEVSNFALRDRAGTGAPSIQSRQNQSAHNLVYWDMESWLGIGPGAVGTLFDGEMSVRYTNTRDTAAWLENPLIPPETEYIDRETLIFEYIMMGLRKREGISRNVFFSRFGIPLEDVIGDAISRWKEKGLAFDNGETGGLDTMGLNREGLLFLNRFLGEI
jgi:oxygen-independent coproporphyrinogen-3 oxidase